MRPLLGHHWRRHRVTFASLAAGLLVFQFFITRIAPEPSQTRAFEGLLQLIPAPLLEALDPEFAGNVNARGVIGFGYAHPFVLVMMSVWAIRLTAAALAGEIGQGTMDLLASRPLPRRRQVGAALVALLAGLAGLLLCGWLGTALGLFTRPVLDIAPWRYLLVALGCWLLFAAFGCIGLLVASLKHQGGAAIGVSSAIIAVSFAWNFLARAWAPVRASRSLSLFRYYQPEQLFNGAAVGDALVLLVVAAAAAGAAAMVFELRDL